MFKLLLKNANTMCLVPILCGLATLSSLAPASAQTENCSKTIDCANKMVSLANKLTFENKQLFDVIKKQADEIQRLKDDTRQIRQFIPYSFSGTNCAVGREIGVIAAIHNDNPVPIPLPGFIVQGPPVAGLTNHNYAILHVCAW